MRPSAQNCKKVGSRAYALYDDSEHAQIESFLTVQANVPVSAG